MAVVDWTNRLERLAEQAGVAGAVLGICADGEQTIAPYGVLSRTTGVEVTADSVFHIGSITKPWTATMIVQLVDEGRLTLDQEVATVLPDAPVPDHVTVRQLLTHTSGIDGDIFTDTGRGDDCLERYVDLLADATQVFPPGAAYSYCNAGFVVLGRMIEVLDGRTWDQSLRARLVEPLGLTGTVTLPEEAVLHRAAVGHTLAGSPVTTWQLPRSIGPAGLIAQRAADLLAFAKFHLDATGTIAAMREPQVAVPGATGGFTAVGLTWRLYDWSGRRLFGHDGQTIDQLAYLRVDPQARLAVCLLTNSANAPALFESLMSEVFDHHVGVRMPPGPQPIEDPAGREDQAPRDSPASTGEGPAPSESPSAAGSAIEADNTEPTGQTQVVGSDRHLGRYARAGVVVDVSRRTSGLIMTYQVTGDRLAFADDAVREYELHPASVDGDRFVLREGPEQPWVPVAFARLADGRPYLFTSGRVTPKVS
jgi:CubicO group peptidase (beta-lactamase class C family)